ncbi:xylulokinase [Enterococcus sp. PF1-24]|uniref:xylulokinase n=1 Tax=unclassified Enterococcus TaxID=2608891 RepID=UPI0024755E14|nr:MULTISPECIES: xylulokinase [unclassified Enterococcus]MDH6365333.1 xylulokinase [Enterococcus sp. PFB1-1]MDH6402411.1 xylulokinase [Enterococcus sp. PF1-24]
MEYVAGLDLGTSSLKGLLVDKAGAVIFEATSEYPLYHKKTGYSEQDPLDWLEAGEKVLSLLAEKANEQFGKIVAISFSGQMHSLVLLDAQGQPLRKAILWNDVRTTSECQEIEELYGAELLEKAKNIPLEGFTLPKILWVKKNEPDLWKKVKKILLPKDFLAYHLTENLNMEYSDAAGTLLLNIEKKIWDREILRKFSIDSEKLPKLVQSVEQIGVLKPSLAEKLNIKNEVKVFAGGADNACAALGAGIVEPTKGLCSIGTSGVFLSYENKEIKDYDGKLHFFNHVIPDAYYSMGVTLAAGQSLTWFKNTFATEESFDELLENVDKIPAGSEGLFFTPYIMGERTPHIDSQIRGSFIGIDAKHQREHFTRAVMEGIIFSLKDSQVLMEDAGKKFEKIVSVGGGAKNKNWLQMQADIFNATIVTLTVEQGPGLGAAMIAAIGNEWFTSTTDCVASFVKYNQEILPDPSTVKKYNKFYERYRKIYPATKQILEL